MGSLKPKLRMKIGCPIWSELRKMATSEGVLGSGEDIATAKKVRSSHGWLKDRNLNSGADWAREKFSVSDVLLVRRLFFLQNLVKFNCAGRKNS